MSPFVTIEKFERRMAKRRMANSVKKYFDERPWWVAKDTWDGGGPPPAPAPSPYQRTYLIRLLRLRQPDLKSHSIQILQDATGYTATKSRDAVNTLEQIRKSINPNPSSVAIEVLDMSQTEWVEFAKWFEFASTSQKAQKKPTPLQLYLVFASDFTLNPKRETQFLVLAENENEARNSVNTNYSSTATKCIEVKGPFKNGTVLMLKHVV